MGTYSKLLTTQSPPSAKPTRAVKHQSLKSTRKVTQQTTQNIDTSREISSEKPRGVSRELPTRDEIQEFSFRLRDELKVKVQAEVPHQWQKELDELARKLEVKKLELYRFIIGDFLGKVKRKGNS